MSSLKLNADSGGGSVALSGPSSTTSNAAIALKLPVADGSANQILKTDGSGQLGWATDNSGISLSGSTDNTIATVTGANALQGEANLTFDGTSLKIGNTFSAHSEGDDLVVGGSGWRGMTIYGEGGGGVIQFADDASNRAGQILYNHSDNSMLFRTNGNTTRFKIDSIGRALLNTTVEGHSNARSLTICKSTGVMGMTLRSDDSSNSHFYFSDSTSGIGEYAGFLNYQHSDNSLHIGTNSEERLRITGTGSILMGATSYGGGGAAPALYVSNSGGRQVKIHNTSDSTSSIQLTNSGTGEGDDNGLQIAVLSDSTVSVSYTHLTLPTILLV